MRNRLVLWLILLLVGFLGGFIPQLLKIQGMQQELSAAQKDLQACQFGAQLSELRDAAALMYLQATQKNFGNAADHARQFFDKAQQILGQTQDAALRNLLTQVLATRDQITADLAKGDAAAIDKIQILLATVEQAAK